MNMIIQYNKSMKIIFFCIKKTNRIENTVLLQRSNEVYYKL